MELIRGLNQLQAKHRPCVASIGNFDGVHLGHQHVISTLLEKSKELGVPSTVITFEPLAREFFSPGTVPRLSSVESRTNCLFELGVDRVLCIEFNNEFSNYSPNDFMQDVLIGGLGIRYLCVGDDFRFGKKRAGDFSMLKDFGVKNGFDVEAHDTFEIAGQRVSSGRIRDALSSSDLALAETLLGRPFTLSGRVTQGQQLGRTIGFPTANIALTGFASPISGVFSVRVQHPLHGSLLGVANVGIRPTVDGTEKRLEVHLFDFDADIYGDTIDVSFHKKIRDEKKFANVDRLKDQIQLDAALARELLSEKQ